MTRQLSESGGTRPDKDTYQNPSRGRFRQSQAKRGYTLTNFSGGSNALLS